MKQAIEKFIHYLQHERNVSPHTVTSYRTDLQQFAAYLCPPADRDAIRSSQAGGNSARLARKLLSPGDVDHRIIREFLGNLHEAGLKKSSVARKLTSLRSFFKFCHREGMIQKNPARLVATPRLPKRVPTVMPAEELNLFLDQLGKPARHPARILPLLWRFPRSKIARQAGAKGRQPPRRVAKTHSWPSDGTAPSLSCSTHPVFA